MVVGYIFSRKDKKEFSIEIQEKVKSLKQRKYCEDCFYDYIRERLLARMLSIEDRTF